MTPATPNVPPRFIIESLVDHGGRVSLGDAYATAAELGIADQPLRLAIRRAVADGQFTQEGRGRRGTLTRTPEASVQAHHDLAFLQHAYAQDAGRAPWSGQWQIVSVAVPESDRSLRDRLRRTLQRMGAALLRSGVYLSPHAEVLALVAAEMPELASLPDVVLATVTDLRFGDQREPRAIAAAVWPLAAVAEAHTSLAEVADSAALAAKGNRSERLAAAVTLAHACEVAHRIDPLLPPELLPQPWAGLTAREALARAWTALDAASLGLFEGYRLQP